VKYINGVADISGWKAIISALFFCSKVSYFTAFTGLFVLEICPMNWLNLKIIKSYMRIKKNMSL
jgi:hypothetical protein